MAMLAAAVTETSTGDPAADLVRTLVGYGLLGMLLLDVLLTQKLVIPRRSYDALIRERDIREQIIQANLDRALADLAQVRNDHAALQGQYLERFLPALSSATDVVKALTEQAGRRLMRDE